MDQNVLRGLLALGYGENVEIPYGELHIPEEFQRKLKPRNWDVFIPALFGRAIVCEVDGVNETVDGIHRVWEGEAHGMWAKQDVPCVRYAGCTAEQAAGLFNLSNVQRVALAAADAFRAACYSGDEKARLLDAALLDLDLDGWCMGRAERDLTAIGTVVQITETHGMEHALYTLDIIGDVWSWDDKEDPLYSPDSPHQRIVKGFSEYLRPMKRVGGRRTPRRWDQANGPMLTSYLATNFSGTEQGLSNFLARAQTKTQGRGVGGGGSNLGVELVLHECFNKARRQQREEAQAA